MAIDLVFHVGTEHPDLVWIVLPALITFMLGIAVGMYASQQRDKTGADTDITEH